MDFAAERLRLAAPIDAERPCGDGLDDTQMLSTLESYRVFGRIKAGADEPDWLAIRQASLDALHASKDLRVLALLLAAALRLNTLSEVLQLFILAASWLERYWDEVYPRIDEDAIARRNALSFFSDRVGVIDAFRRAPIAKDARLGTCSVRDFEIARGFLAPSDRDTNTPSDDQIRAVLTVAEPLEIAEVHGFVREATQAVRIIEETMMNRGGGSHAVPQLDTLRQVLQHMQQMLEPFVRQPTAAAESAATQSPNTAVSALSSTVPLEEIVSREDVLRALDAVMSYYRNHEPGSLVPTIAERAKRLVSMSFFEALAEVAPDVVDPVKKAVGVREPF